jgi:hypothetical protein
MLPLADPFTQLGLTNAPPSPSTTLDPFANYGMAPATVMPPAGAIEALRSNPALAKEFEAKYGVPATDYLSQ